MKPIGQTFFINEPAPPAGVPGVYIKRIDVFFKTISAQFGIEMQIRLTENGVPTSERLPFASKIVFPSDRYANTSPILTASDDASTYSSFIFDTPVFTQSGKSYAFVLIPLGGNPDFEVWTGKLSEADVTSGSPIYTNSGSGDLFLSSNDIGWTPVHDEDMKYTIHIANFTSLTGTARWISQPTERITFINPTGTFVTREPLFLGTAPIRTGVLNVTNLLGTFNIGDTVYQTDGVSRVYGTIYGSNSSVIKISNATGSFLPTSGNTGLPYLFNANSTSNGFVNSVSQSISTSLNSNVISVPDSSVFPVGSRVYLQTNSNFRTAFYNVTNNSVNSTSVSLHLPAMFTDTNAAVGNLIVNTSIGTYAQGSYRKTNDYQALIELSISNTTFNLLNYKNSNAVIIGFTSRSSATLTSVYDSAYTSVTPQFMTTIPANTTLGWNFSGFHADALRTPDDHYITIDNGVPNEEIDFSRVMMSLSNEQTDLPIYRQGNTSFQLNSNFATANTKVSAAIDTIRRAVVFTRNIITPANQTSGFVINYTSNNIGIIPVGANVTQTVYGNTSWGSVLTSNSTTLTLNNINGTFISNTDFTANGVVGTAAQVMKFGESLNKNNPSVSRYIGKNVILAAGQDSEDLRAYLTAYRPANTNIFVYASIIHHADNDLFDNKDWSKLTELSSPALTSSIVNVDDQVELVYEFATSQRISPSGTVTSNASQNVTCTSTANFSNNSFIYLESDDTAKSFNVRQVIYVTNSTSMVLDRPPSFTSANAAIGLIPEIRSTSSAFLYDHNNNIVRYCTPGDSVFDGYIEFAIKIVLVADTQIIVPRVGDIRVIAMQT